ncbi:hypothetical protein CORC01_01984 [Colletotrichum orchidophilum]|uniref:Serine/threonine-protein kinase ppk6 n=1 Tax=Colletotrichum orchidophilum TaxID=1209926 RepID=A0A1G4BMR0_9PEZI|nr:uncharacterized protein CORC01_01984 [Colletotrichum orchidophilum]OHF02588.1 hypothetical protein CORC01_01984 [Colletotrichum orchidophilum]
MSADLLDLDSFYQSPPSQKNQTGGQQGQLQPQRPQQVTASSTDLFDFASFTSNNVSSRPTAAPAPVQQTVPWPNFEPQQPSGGGGGSSSGGGWGDFGAFSSGFTSSSTAKQQPKQTLQIAEDDDGWGEFEVAEPTPTQRSFVMPPQTNKARSSPPPRNRIARASTFDLMTNNLINVVDMPYGSGLSPIPSPGLPSPNQQPAASSGPSWQQTNRQPSPGLSWQAAGTKPPVSPGFSSQTPSAKPQPSPGFSSQMYGSQKKPSPEPAKQSDPNILFDAEEFELQGGNDDDDDDEFGDFETVQTPFPGANMSPTLDSRPPTQRQPPPQPTQQQPPSIDLLSLSDEPFPVSQPPPKKPQLSSLSLNAPASPYPQAPKSPSFQERNPFPGLGLTTPTYGDFKEDKKDKKPESPTPVTAWPAFGQTSPTKPSTAAVAKKPTATTNLPKTQEEENWPDFEDFPDDEPSAIDSSRPPESWDWDAIDGVKSSTPAPAPKTTTNDKKQAPKPKKEASPAPLSEIPDDAPPPINIPPPSVILSIFPQLLDLANSSLFKPTSQMAAPIRKRILEDPSTVTFLRGYLLLATVAARVIAGRKLRWHRDKFLSQGMAISAAGAKGMKLAGVDKAQAAREEREATDVVGVWREHVGRLRSAVAAANSAGAAAKNPRDQLRVPELNETIPVSTAKVVPTAPKPCVICGLKRDERVSKVDFEVEDSFGEWWVEHWGHRACKNFWVEHEKKLRQR